MIPSPQGLTFEQWANVSTEELSAYNIFARPDEKLWREWAKSVISIPDLEPQGLPDPNLFSSWQSWAVSLSQALQ